MLNKKSLALASLLTAVVAAPAMAGQGFYVFGQAQHDRQTEGKKEVANGASVGGGYRLNDHLAVETTYTRLKNRDTRMATEAATVRGLAILPINAQAEVFAKVGYAHVGNSLGRHAAEGVTGGLGASYRFAKNWSIRADYDRLNEHGKQKQDSYGVGVQYAF